MKDQRGTEILEQLVKKAQAGDIKAFGQIYDQFVQKIYKYMYFKVKGEDAMDLTENLFLKVWENLKKYQARPGITFSAWIFRIAHNLVVDYYRQHKEFSDLDTNLEDARRESSPATMTELSMDQEMVRSALGKLKKQHQEIITICFLNEFDNSEAAKILNKTEGALRVLKFRALQEMKQVLLEMGYKFQ